MKFPVNFKFSISTIICLIICATLFAFVTAIESNDTRTAGSKLHEENGHNIEVSNITAKSIPEPASKVTLQIAGRKRAAKILEEPIKSLLEHDSNESKIPTSSSPIFSVLSPPIAVEKSVEEDNSKRSNSPQVDGENINSMEKRRLSVKAPHRRQDLLSLLTQPAPPVKFTTVVSPIEASFGGFTGLQGLPPLSFIQFVKMLVALTPFILPMIFIPLLIFTIGVLMLPVTRKNVFFDLSDLRSSNQLPSSTSSAILSNYIISPVKNFAGNVVMPRAYQFASDIVSHEECIEKISCELSARYLKHGKWNGNWRSIANRSWISRILSYWWGDKPTVARIAKSLDSDEFSNWPRNNETETLTHKPGKLKEIGTKPSSLVRLTNWSNSGDMKLFSESPQCLKYTCQPKSFIRKILS